MEQTWRRLCGLFLWVELMASWVEGTGLDLASTPTVASVVPKAHNLSCLTCHSVEDGDSCVHLNHSDISHMATKCSDGRVVCMVKRFSYALTKNGTLGRPDTWSIERGCVKSCESGCIIMGERTKLHVCMSCCNDYLCNVDNSQRRITAPDLLFLVVFIFSCAKATYSFL